MTAPKISIVTPSFNQGLYIEDTIRSVVEQNYPLIEYIVIDGGSNDQSVDIINKYRDRIFYFISEKDTGQSEAINKGFRKATGEIIAWLNSDDMYFPYTLNTVAEIFEKNKEVDLIYGDVEHFYEDGGKEYYSVSCFEAVDFLSRVSVHQPSVFWRKKILDNAGLLDEKLQYLMDYDLWMRIFFNYNTLKVDKLLSRFRIHKNAKTSNNPPGLYYDYRKVFSRFINSCSSPGKVSVLDELGIYDNPENISYTFFRDMNEEMVNKAFIRYIKNCIIQEYSWGNIKRVNHLIFHKKNPISDMNNFILFLKNNTGIGLLKYKWKK